MFKTKFDLRNWLNSNNSGNNYNNGQQEEDEDEDDNEVGDDENEAEDDDKASAIMNNKNRDLQVTASKANCKSLCPRQLASHWPPRNLPTANILVGNGATAVNDPTPAGVGRNEIQNHHTESPLPGPGLIIALAGLFLWSNNSTFIHKSAPHILKVHIPEKLVLEFASALRNEVNRALAVLREIAARKDLKIFFMVIVGLWIASILVGCCDFLTLFYVSTQQSMRRMIYPTGLEHASPALSHGTKDEMHHATHANRMSVVSRRNRGRATSEDDLKKQMRLPRS
ncbi:Reticulon-like protein B4 [Capsicum annuum]|nr:Reticulon-like protein B4 [Capsicum annuum]